jgi:hypothetical protein
LPSARALCRIALCGESGLDFKALARFQYDFAASRRAQTSAPIKLGILPWAPEGAPLFHAASPTKLSVGSALLVASQ